MREINDTLWLGKLPKTWNNILIIVLIETHFIINIKRNM